ncbi:hypothetical protein BG621_02570 [Parasaccharibacter apium]|nr:hypothetical protein BG621_02570 [Parasaccharibacter apium]
MSDEDATYTCSPTMRVMPVVFFNLLVYFVIGLPNAIIGAQFVHNTLGFSTAIAASTISLQYIGTAMGRVIVGHRIDVFGPKAVLRWGLILCTISGLLMCLAALIPTSHLMGMNDTARYVALAVALISRLFIGWSESCTSTSVTTWNLRRVGPAHSSVAISWNGVTSYGGIAVGVTVGQWLSGLLPTIKLLPVGIFAAALGICGFIILTFYKAIKPLPSKGKPMSFGLAVKKVLPYGAALAAGSVGFGTVNSFLALYYTENHWTGLGIAFGVFAACFIFMRIFVSGQIDKHGGVPIAYMSLVTEAIAMAVFCLVHNNTGGLIGAALTGAGFSLLFPAMGTMAVKTDGPEFHGILIAAYSIFTDITIVVSSWFMGGLRDHMGWGVMFAVAGVLCVSGIAFSSLFSRIPGCGIPKNTQ